MIDHRGKRGKGEVLGPPKQNQRSDPLRGKGDANAAPLRGDVVEKRAKKNP